LDRVVDQPTMDAIMQDARSAGASAIRTWFFQSYYDLDASGRAAPPSFSAFDRVLGTAAAYGLKVIPVLMNEFPTCEAPGAKVRDLSFFENGYRQPQPPYALSFARYAATVARHYSGDQTIAFWQLGNELYADEPSCGAATEGSAARALRSFADAMTGAIRAVDPHHLVSLGTIGTGQCGLSGRDYAYVQAGAVDICDYHDYGDVTHSVPNDGFNRLAQRIAECRAMHKPLVVSESGIPADVDDRGRSAGAVSPSSLQLRAGFFDAKLTAAFAAGIMGYGLWEMQQSRSDSPYNRGQSEYEIGPGDPTGSVTARLAATLGARGPRVRADFEDGRDGWVSAAGRLALADSTAEAWDGDHSLAIFTLGGAGALATARTAGARSGTTLVVHVFRPELAPATVSVQPQAISRRGLVKGPSTALLAGWNTVSWRLPAHPHRRLRRIGLAILNPSAWSGPLYLDGVAWGR
jgi:hypothetical protein